MWYNDLANLAALVHGFVVFPAMVIVPIILVIKGRLPKFFEYSFVGVTIFAVISLFVFQDCILSIWERELRELAGQEVYRVGFLTNYLGKVGIPWSDKFTLILVSFTVGLGTATLATRRKQ